MKAQAPVIVGIALLLFIGFLLFMAFYGFQYIVHVFSAP
jgi:hypothetical protein